ncbi:bacillithiol system protein [Paenibacillus selenitireducens]|uniref:Bacillithiol system protein n=1 Tax=Paenibacillus selenitireducens TaxID=1324314 RepID=A0A1T2XKF6_9BACL|nr:bacillithiol system redox-active protein YtxJ [Paenibacillus selenitireducens]OPA80173.1 bacillithiol system protein [Paenibacillus selenitireducens]
MSGLIMIQTEEQLTEWLQKTCETPLFLYKHSTHCGPSRNAHVTIHRFIDHFPERSSKFLFAVIRVIEEKSISNQVTQLLGIPHQSPQVLLIRDNKVLWHASHQRIHVNSLCAAADQFFPG